MRKSQDKRHHHRIDEQNLLLSLVWLILSSFLPFFPSFFPSFRNNDSRHTKSTNRQAALWCCGRENDTFIQATLPFLCLTWWKRPSVLNVLSFFLSSFISTILICHLVERDLLILWVNEMKCWRKSKRIIQIITLHFAPLGRLLFLSLCQPFSPVCLQCPSCFYLFSILHHSLSHSRRPRYRRHCHHLVGGRSRKS